MLDSTVFDLPAKKVCLHLLHVEKDWVEFSAIHKLFNKDVWPELPDYLSVSYDYDSNK